LGPLGAMMSPLKMAGEHLQVTSGSGDKRSKCHTVGVDMKLIRSSGAQRSSFASTRHDHDPLDSVSLSISDHSNDHDCTILIVVACANCLLIQRVVATMSVA
jgi:hypothetical protein